MTSLYAIDSLRRRSGISNIDAAIVVPPNLPADQLEARTILEELISKGDYSSVVRLTADMDPSPYWIDQAIIALLRADKWKEGKRLYDLAVAHTGDRKTLPGKAMVTAVLGLLGPSEGKELVPGNMLSDNAEIFADHVLLDVDRRLNALRVGSGIESGLDSDLCILTVQLIACLGKPERATDAITLLLEYTEKFPVQLAGLMERGVITVQREVPGRLRVDYPEDLSTHMLAGVIEGRLLGQPKAALEQLLKKRYLATSDQELLALQDLLSSLAEASGEDEAKGLVKGLREFWSFSDDRLQDLADAMELIESQELSEAEQLIEKRRNSDDPAWLRVYAALQIARGNEQNAAETLFKSAELNPHWLAFAGAAELAVSCQDWELACRSLEEALSRNPTDSTIRNNLIAVCDRLGRLEDVEHLLKDILSSPGENLSQRLMYARFLMEQGRYPEALELLSKEPALVDVDLGAMLLKAELVRLVEGPEQALEYVNALADHFAESKQYWFMLLDLSYAAGNDERGHEALETLLSLKERGLVSDKELWSESIDEIRSLVEEQKKRHDQVTQSISVGKLPWLFEAERGGVSAWFSWIMHTQPLLHLWDQPSQKVEYSIYATNGFTIDHKGGSVGHLAPVLAPKVDSSVVADFSALMTLTQLGLLERAGDFFAEIIVPKKISFLLVGESRRLRPHQKSEFDASASLVQALREKKIKTIEQLPNEFDGVVLDPYNVWGDGVAVGYNAVLEALRNSGKISEEDFESSKNLFKETARGGDDRADIALGSKLLAEETALRMIARRNLLGLITDGFDVYLVSRDVSEIQSKVRVYEALDSAKQANEHLVAWIRDCATVHFSDSVVDDDGLSGDWASDAYKISKQRNLPLLADDRVWHALRANEAGRGGGVAFDSSELVRALHTAGFITVEEQLDAFLKLIDWRYKFLTVPAEVMYAAALRYRAGLPGEPLRRIAQYLHDSVSDPAMFGGIEPVEPPASMAAKWTFSWISQVADFLVMVWSGDLIETDKRSELTIWVARCMLPSTVASMNPIQRMRILDSLPVVALSHFAMEGLQKGPIENIHQGFKLFAHGLGLERDAIERITEDLIQRAVAND